MTSLRTGKVTFLLLATLFVLSGCDDAIDIDAHRRGTADKYMIAAANPLAADAGRSILANGGSAVDAAIATEMVLTLVEPQSSGIGGGAFLVHHDAADGVVETYDGREAAPASAHPGMFLQDDGTPMPWPKAALGGRAVGIPGVMRMLAMAHADHGVLPWADLFQPAIRLAKEGFAVSPRLAGLLAADTEMPEIPSTREYFYPDGKPLKAGDTLRNPALARVLKTVAEHGAAAFYAGDISAGIAETVATTTANPAKITAEDFASYMAKKRDPVCVTYRVFRVCGMGPPSSGGILIGQILGVLNHFDLPSMTPFSAEAVHLIVEASRLAFADRGMYVADSDFIPVPVAGLLDPRYLASRAKLISPGSRMQQALPGRAGRTAWHFRAADGAEKGLSTTHFSIRDRYGNVVSITASIERAFGSKHMSQGFLLNNELTDFSFRPTSNGHPVANAAAPGKRPRSTMSPTIVFDKAGKPVLAIGSPGGSRIAGYTLKVILAVLDWNMHVADAISAPNIVSRGGPIDIEAGTAAESLKPALEAMGHDVRLREMTSGLHGIHFTPEGLTGGADPRREGIVLGE
ncbi:MAG: gamma-glutamyltransferase [Rhodospirillales bacterium]|nr:gamma-glutamyltransferase [Rhodospirillales bacterium]MBO6787941.1 gamma-glutamyltransferase [Rhodospirillales bacterium]